MFSKRKKKLLLDGYIRNEYKSKSYVFPNSLNELIFNFYYYLAKLLQFDTKNICSTWLIKRDKTMKLTDNNCKATKVGYREFVWINAKLSEGIKTEIRVFRYKIYNKT